jgi:hypothetical protein
METAEWDQFMLKYSGDVDTTVSMKAAEIEKLAQSWKGVSPTLDQNGTFLSESTNPEEIPLAVLEAEKLVSADRETAGKLNAVSTRIAQETVALERLREKLAGCEGARERRGALATEREQGLCSCFRSCPQRRTRA